MTDLVRPYLHRWDRSRYQSAWLCLPRREPDIQSVALEYLHRRGIPAMAVDVGAKKLRGRAYGALKAAGLSMACLVGQTGAGVAGLTDIIGCIPPKVHGLSFPWGIPLFIEVKVPEQVAPGRSRGEFRQVSAPGRPSQDQLDFMDAMHGAGACVGVIWSLNDLLEVLP